MGADRHREAVRTRPRIGARPHRDDPHRLSRGRGLPDRSLPRQGDRSEHPGLALRERDLRAGLEPSVRRPRADHRSRDNRRRGARRLLRARRGDARHRAEPPSAARHAGRHGAAGCLRRQGSPRREGEGPPRAAAAGLEPNALVLRIQPDEGISLKFGAKVPVQGIRIRSVNMDFVYGASFMVDAPDAYETLILDALRGDATLFTRRDEVDQQWAFVDPIMEAWGASPTDPPIYEAGTWGPVEAHVLIERDGREWRKA